MLTLGWSVLEGIGAALVLPAMVALVAGNFEGQGRALAYGVLGGVAGAGHRGRADPGRLGDHQIHLAAGVRRRGRRGDRRSCSGRRLIRERRARGGRRRLDWVGGVLSALGLGLVVLGVLQASNWGWLQPRNSPVEPFGFSLDPVRDRRRAASCSLSSRGWQRRREERGEEPLIHLRLLRMPPLRGGLAMLLAQNLILMGIFFTIPLYLQIVQGLDAFETGVRMLPVSVALFVTALVGSALAQRFPAAAIVRAGIGVLFVAS